MNIKLNNKLTMPDVSGKNLTFNINVDLFDKSFKFYFNDWGAVKELELNYLNIKKQFDEGHVSLESFVSDINLNLFVVHYLYDLTKLLQKNKIDSEKFITKSFEILKEYSIYTKKNPDYEPMWIYYEMYFNFYRLYNRYDLVLELIYTYNTPFDFSLIHDLEYNLNIKVLNAELLLRYLKINSSLNQIVKIKLIDYKVYIDKILSEIYLDNNSFYSSFFGEKKSITEINKEFPNKYIISGVGHSAEYRQTRREDSFEFLKNNNEKTYIKKYSKVLNQYKTDFSGKCLKRLWNNGQIWLSYDENPLSYINGNYSFLYFIENSFRLIFLSIVFSNQDNFRTSIGLPKIGQGWVSETNLFNSINSYFDNIEVIQHASPKWLGRQHLDIYLKELNIGIEYQGKQHSEPIDFFGGIEGHAKTVERDERKKTLCIENNCNLLFVYPDTNIDKFIIELEKIIHELTKI
jgi:hypothetical protein